LSGGDACARVPNLLWGMKMQVTETLNEGLKRGYNITVTADELDAKVNEKLAEAQPEVEMKGFRKGKVPMALLKKQFGPRLLGEAMQETIDGAMNQHFEDSGDRPALQPKVEMVDGEDWKEGDDVKVEMSYEALPAIPEVDLASISLEKMVVKADDAAVDEALGNLAETAQDFKARRKGSKAKDGDQVVMDFVGKVDGEAFDGGSAEDYPLVLGSNSFIPGFEEQLVGVKAGEEKNVEVTFPAEYQAEALAGKDAVFACTIKEVAEPAPAEIDDELAKKFGADDLNALKEQMKERLETEYSQASRQVMKRNLLDALDEKVKFDLPEGLVSAEAGQIAQQLWHEENTDATEPPKEPVEPTDEHKTLAERRVRLGLLLADIGRKAEVEVTEGEINQAIFQQAQQYPGQEKQFFDFMKSNEQAMQQLRAPIFEDKVVDYVLELAETTDKSVKKEDLEKAIEALDD